MNTQIEQPPFVLAAILAGRLYRMLETARSMNISSSNAKGISMAFLFAVAIKLPASSRSPTLSVRW